MKETKDIDAFMNRVTTVVNQLKIYVDEIKYQIVVEKAIIYMSTKFEVVVATIEEVRDLTSVKIDELVGSLLSHEARIDKNKDFTLETSFKSHVSISRDRD